MLKSVYGRVHSIDSFSAVDGPGIRYVIFLQGCKLRCKICSNPDTWNLTSKNSKLLSTKEISQRLVSLKPYFGKDGGVTVSGGEALLQPEFVSDLFKRVHDIGLTTCIDTAGYAPEENTNTVLPHTDYTLFCIKHIDPEKYLDFTGQNQNQALRFWEKLEESSKKYLIRYVLVPGFTDSKKDIEALCREIKKTKNCDGVELLPYHTLGKYKWEMLGLNYTMDHISIPTKEYISEIASLFKEEGIRVKI